VDSRHGKGGDFLRRVRSTCLTGPVLPRKAHGDLDDHLKRVAGGAVKHEWRINEVWSFLENRDELLSAGDRPGTYQINDNGYILFVQDHGLFDSSRDEEPRQDTDFGTLVDELTIREALSIENRIDLLRYLEEIAGVETPYPAVKREIPDPNRERMFHFSGGPWDGLIRVGRGHPFQIAIERIHPTTGGHFQTDDYYTPRYQEAPEPRPTWWNSLDDVLCVWTPRDLYSLDIRLGDTVIVLDTAETGMAIVPTTIVNEDRTTEKGWLVQFLDRSQFYKEDQLRVLK
jgi:hypothetical protein